MEFRSVIESRRSVRSYRDRAVPEELVGSVLDAGRLAPSGGNMQPWEFVLVRGKENIRRASAATYLGNAEAGGKTQEWLNGAPVLVIVCVDWTRSVARYGEKGRRIALMDACAAIENMLLAAVDAGLGSCWVSGFRTEELAAAFGIPAPVEPIAMLPLGYAERVPAPPFKFERREITHEERYGAARGEEEPMPDRR